MEESTSELTFEGCSVIFRNVKEYYSAEDEITCAFSVKENNVLQEASDSCYIGLFHVGWDSLTSCVAKKKFSCSEKTSHRSFFVTFLANEIPESNIDEFYQFCFYNINTEVVFGASCANSLV